MGMELTDAELQAQVKLLRLALGAALQAIEYACEKLSDDTAAEVRSFVDGSCESLNARLIMCQDIPIRALQVLIQRERRRVARTVSAILGGVVDSKLLLTEINECMEKKYGDD